VTEPFIENCLDDNKTFRQCVMKWFFLVGSCTNGSKVHRYMPGNANIYIRMSLIDANFARVLILNK
jgi:hypothetical protein